MMEVDTHSPSPRMTRTFNYSLKRPRSPASPSQERQPKRSALALQDACPSRRPPSSVLSTNQTADNRHQPSPDDWVRQASDLTIGTPLSLDPLPSPSGDGGQVQDENMALDLDEPPKSCPAVLAFSSPELQQLFRARPPTTQLDASQAYISPPQHLSQPPVTFGSSPSIITGPAGAQPLIPSINLAHQQQHPSVYGQPGTSPYGSSNQQELHSGPTQNHDFVQSTSSGMSFPPPPPTSQYPGLISSSGRKQRFTMGPRADCLKCRMGVKGHWMHFD
ncbi:uncharacterized protein EDB91DRAFT_18411 [Suillus paluster]|uniref:uncharacterized protein n=1 Tax=Suillus paluster TaxID=48578 RepID=UPI001B877F45|nr:uncharacterized protein EDB91DRAFT_18411 [Suillus paluster]KAG1756486.1 hypothetical protein EDB91DRAFT_18411 [Suillus paluster]